MPTYPGPLRDEPLAVELHNTRYAAGGTMIDGLADEGSARAWLAGIAGRLPEGGAGREPTADELDALREPVREALHATLEGRAPGRRTIEAINGFSRRAPQARVARWRRGSSPALALDFGNAGRSDIVLGALAADALELLSGPLRSELRACGAPGCVLLFVCDHPRREWCCAACGNRARQARHYARSRST
jgi:predicted RNA-binding Zn ribbon-like protein